MESLEGTLSRLLVPDNNIIQQATRELREAFKDPAIISKLCAVFSSVQNAQVQQYAAVLLRRLILRKRQWIKLSAETQQGIKIILLRNLKQESEKPVRNAICQLIGTVAKHELPSNRWPELFSYVHSLIGSNIVADKELGMFIMSVLASMASEELKPHLSSLLQLLFETLQYKDSILVPFYTMRTLTSLICVINNPVAENQFQPIFPLTFDVLQQLVLKDEELASEAMELFDELIEWEVGVIVRHMKAMVNIFLDVCSKQELSENLRIKAMTLIALLARLKNKTISKQKLVVPILRVMFPLMCATPTHIEEGEMTDIDLDDAEANTTASNAAQVIDSLALHLPPDKVVPPLLQYIEPALQSSNQYHRRAAFLALAVIAEGCSDYICAKYLETHLGWICKGIGDESSIVRSAALFALGQFSEHLQPDISKYASELLPVLFQHFTLACQVLPSSNEDPPGITKVFYALENYCENLGDDLVPFLPTLMDRLFTILSSSKSVHIRELTISIIGAIAHAVEGGMVPYFERTIHELQVYLMQPHSEELAPLQIQSLETLGVLARTIGADHFRPLARESVQLGLSLIDTVNDPDIRRCAYELFASVSTVLGSEMAEFLPAVVSHAINSLLSSEGLVMKFAEDGKECFPIFDDIDESLDEDSDDDDNDVEGYSVENAYVAEKEDACSALKDIAANTGSSFLPHLEICWMQVSNMMDYITADVRKSALEALGQFTIVVGEFGSPDDTQKAVEFLVPNLMDMVRKDQERVVVMAALETLNNLVNSLKSKIITLPNHLDAIVSVIYDVMQQKLACQDQSEAGDNDGTDDDDDDTQDAEQDALLFEYAGELVPSLGRVVPPMQFAPYFSNLMAQFVSRTKKASIAERSFSVGTLAESVQALGSGGIKPFVPHLLNVFLSCAHDENWEVRSNSIFGLGVLVEHGQEVIVSQYPTILKALASALQVETDARAIDNICGAVARCILTNGNAVPLDQVFPVLIRHLPLRKDFEENAVVFQCICCLFAMRHPQVFGNLDSILKVVGVVLHTDQIKPETEAELLKMVHAVKNEFPNDFDKVLSAWEPQLAGKLRAALESLH